MINIYKDLTYSNEQVFLEIESLIFRLDLDYKTIVKRQKVPHWVSVAKAYLIANWNKPVSLEELSKLCGVHKVTISKNFPKYLGSSVRIYQRKIRIIRAIEFINSDKYSLTEIAFLCGFADQSHFTRFFRQIIGFLPKQLPKALG